jgi:hypothetical protein
MIKKLIILTFVTISLMSCNKEIYLTNPKMFSNPSSPSLFDTIAQELIVDLIIDGENTIPDSYTWSILDSDSNLIVPIKIDENIMLWVPCKEDTYTIKCQISVGNMNLTDIERYTIKYNQNTMQNKLTGKWKAIGSIQNDYEWTATFNIKNGYYLEGNLDEIIKGDVRSPFGKINDYVSNQSTIVIYDWLGEYLFDGSIHLSNNGGMMNMEFSNDFKTLMFDLSLTDYTIEDKNNREYIVNYTFRKQED